MFGHCSIALLLSLGWTSAHFAHSLQQETMHTQSTPQFLYKIVSLRNWQSTQSRKNVFLPSEDDAFIHLATEDQLEKVIAKFWSEAPQFVVLKLVTDQLQGNLVLEANPGKTTQYYHLYQGFIPLSAIVESRTIFKEPLDSCAALKLNIVHVGDSVLRLPAKELTKEEILSPEVQELIQDMKETMRSAPGIGLAAPQVGRALQIAVIEDMDHSFLTPEQIADRERKTISFHVIINPKITLDETEMRSFFEGCLSVPGFMVIVPRARKVRVECLNERAEPVSIEASGWYARTLQHEIDHLHGTLLIDRGHLETLTTDVNYTKLWKSKKPQDVIALLKDKHE
jgi:peptide deformylase